MPVENEQVLHLYKMHHGYGALATRNPHQSFIKTELNGQRFHSEDRRYCVSIGQSHSRQV